MTTLHQRKIAIGVATALLLSGFAMGRVFDSPKPASAEESKAALVQTPLTQPATAGNEAFYLKDFKTGYDDGYQMGLTKQSPNLAVTERAGYNEGFKEGYADSYQLEQRPIQGVPVSYRNRPGTVYRTSYAPARRRSSKLKTALTIAAPAAIGAGIGVAAGGKKGAAVGALLGGGGGALYHLFKNRD